MIIVDLETTGVEPYTHQMVSLGAVDFDTGDEFYEECRINPYDIWTQEALDINGFTYEQITDQTKQYPSDLYRNFLAWAKDRSTLLAGQNVGSFDFQFLKAAAEIEGDEFPFQYKTVDLHSVFFGIKGKSYSMSKICKSLGVEPEPKPHNALNGARCEYECFKILLKK